MPIVFCDCGVKYKVDHASLGKRARCKKCGQVFELAIRDDSEEPFTLADLDELADGTAQQRVAPARVPQIPPATPPSPPMQPPAFDQHADPAGSVAGGGGGLKAYLAALPRVFGYPARPRNLGMLLGVWALMAVGTIGAGVLIGTGYVRASCLGLIVFVFVEGTFAAFCFNTVRQMADGDDNLPSLPVFLSIDEWWPAAIAPFLAMLLTYAIALGPAIIYSIVSDSGATEDLAAMIGLLALGLLLWPMLVLALAMGDFKALVRIDAMVATAAQTIPAYLITLLLVYGCAATLVFAVVKVPESDTAGIATAALVLGIRIYTQIAAMRAIGSYYYCYESRFEWL